MDIHLIPHEIAEMGGKESIRKWKGKFWELFSTQARNKNFHLLDCGHETSHLSVSPIYAYTFQILLDNDIRCFFLRLFEKVHLEVAE